MNEKIFKVTIEIPKEPPKTAYEFEAFWNNAKNDMDIFYKYFKQIPYHTYSQIFKSSMNGDILNSIITILKTHYIM